MIGNTLRVSVLGLWTFWLCGCGESAGEGEETTTFHVQEMGERLKLL